MKNLIMFFWYHGMIDGKYYGNFNTSKQSPKCGSSYQGVHSSGPLWSVKPQKNSLVRLWPKDIMKTLHYSFVLKERNSANDVDSVKF